MTAFTTHFGFEFRVGIRNKSLLLLNYLFPLGFYLLGGMLMTGLNPGFREILIPGMVFFAILSSTLLGMPDPLVTAREAGIFRSYKIHGIPELPILVIPALTTILHMVVVAVIIVATAPLLFDAVLPANWGGFILAFLLLAVACTGIGLLIGVIVPNSRTAVLFSQAIFLPSMMIGGLMFPSSQLPSALKDISYLLPTTHAMNIYGELAQSHNVALSPWMSAMVNAVSSALPEADAASDAAVLAQTHQAAFNPWLSAVVLLAGGALAFGLAIYLFNWDRQNRTQRGRPALALLALLPYAIALLLSLM
jgi:ABC-2 type transport system permease protein